MKLLLDNLAGLGAVDYTGCLDHAEALTITRTLNAPSTVKAMLCLEGSGLAQPVRRARVVVTNDAGTTLFTGYLTTEPVPVYAGVGTRGPVYRLALHAVSDEWLLDRIWRGAGAGLGAETGLGASGASVLQTLVNRAGGSFVTAGALNVRTVGVYAGAADSSWSGHVGGVAGASYGAYRVLHGAVSMPGMPGAVHVLADGAGAVQIAGFQASTLRELANDVTVSGAVEPTTYWTEVFAGDGSTQAFTVSGEPAALRADTSVLLADAFDGEAFNREVWQLSNPGQRLSLTGAGLTMNGGNGLDGQTTLTAWDAIELGGTLVLELGTVRMNAGSAGVIGGLYTGAIAADNCVAGFNLRQAGGQTLCAALVNGVEVGTPLPLLAGHAYTLRLRVHAAELDRVRQQFYGRDANGGVALFGGGFVDAGADAVFEARDAGASSNTTVTVLYDGPLASAGTSTPASVMLCAVNSLQLFGSIGSIHVEQSGTAWMRSVVAATGAARTVLIGGAYDGVDCTISSAGTVTFFAGRQPAPGEHVFVLYRGRRRAVARVADAASIAEEAAGGGQGTARWLGRVVSPPARTTEDCETAALAVLSAAANRDAALAGSYTAVNTAGGDIWPGDGLQLPAANGAGATQVLVRQVTVEDRGAAPEALTYRVRFANDWAEELGVRLSETFATDALLPATALDLTPAPTPDDIATLPAHVLANLPELIVTAIDTTMISVDTGQAPPVDGGFEVRRRDGGFGSETAAGLPTTVDGDLVLRTPVRGFQIPRAAAEERFFVRMYDASTPPLYSRFSSAIATHVPVVS